MKNRRMALQVLVSVVIVLNMTLLAAVAEASATLHRPDDLFISHLGVDGLIDASPMALNTTQGFVKPMVAAGGHTVGLKTDGTAVAVGQNLRKQCDIGSWTDITQVAAGGFHTVGLKSDGTVIAVGLNHDGQCNVGNWTDIIQVAAGELHTVGIKDDGTVVAVGLDYYGQCAVGGWRDIVQVTAGWFHTVGLKLDGTVVAVGPSPDSWSDQGQCDVGKWRGITQVAAGLRHTVGLKADGTVVAVGWNDHRQCDVGRWRGITQIAAGTWQTLGIRSDGTVIAAGNNSYGECDVDGWSDIIGVAASGYTVGLKADGTVVAVGGWNSEGQLNVADWNLGVVRYALTIASTEGGSVTEPGEGAFTFDKGTVVDLVATPDTGYEFANWTGTTSIVADVEAGVTNITMHSDYSITANFEEIPLPPVSWPLIGGIIAVVVIVGLGTFFLVRRKGA